MAKAAFQKNNISNTTLCRLFSDDTAWAETTPLAHKVFYTFVDLSDTDYNNLYKGKKNIVINNDNTISTADLPDASTDNKVGFKKNRDIYLETLFSFKEKYPNHSKTSEINDVIDFIESIDVENLIYPHTEFHRHCVDNNKYIILSYI